MIFDLDPGGATVAKPITITPLRNGEVITGAAITQLTQAGTDASDKQAVITVKAQDLDVDGGFTHVALVMTVGTATSDAGAVVIGMPATYGPATNADLASVLEVVNA